MWKPGNLVTVKGIVYRVKRESETFTACENCAFGGELCCSFPMRFYKRYPMPMDCYLKRVSP